MQSKIRGLEFVRAGCLARLGKTQVVDGSARVRGHGTVQNEDVPSNDSANGLSLLLQLSDIESVR